MGARSTSSVRVSDDVVHTVQKENGLRGLRNSPRGKNRRRDTFAPRSVNKRA